MENCDVVLDNEKNSLRRRINFVQNSKGTNVETTYEMIENGTVLANEEVVKKAKELFDQAKKAVGA